MEKMVTALFLIFATAVWAGDFEDGVAALKNGHPGWAGHLSTGLGKALMDKGFDVTGRETRGEFKDLSFTDQVETVKEDLLNNFWTEDSRVIANSFGAYIFLHAQASLEPYPGKVLLLSPSVGGFADDTTGMIF